MLFQSHFYFDFTWKIRKDFINKSFVAYTKKSKYTVSHLHEIFQIQKIYKGVLTFPVFNLILIYCIDTGDVMTLNVALFLLHTNKHYRQMG